MFVWIPDNETREHVVASLGAEPEVSRWPSKPVDATPSDSM
jgi:hypothetical protein